MHSKKANIIFNTKVDNLLLILIIVTGSIMRLWNFQDLQYMHDELSALSRLEFNKLSDLIIKGVAIGDNHPAGIQVFLYYWTKLFGTSELVVKMPFILSGILSIYITYLIGKLWFNNTTGLFSAAMVSTTQYFIMYSQIARPYATGLLFTLLAVYYWSRFMFTNRKTISIILFVIFSTLSAYNHHFSLLFVGIVSISGFFIIKDKYSWKLYLMSLACIILLYIPHLKILFAQLMRGSIGGWLAKPNISFIFDYMDYMIQYSIVGWIAIIICVSMLWLLPGNQYMVVDKLKKRILLTAWFLLPIAIGYFYSVIRNPILQYSILIFSAPYIYLFLFSFSRKVNKLAKFILLVSVLGINIFGLIRERQHYNIFYHQPYEELYITALIDNSERDVFVINDCIPYYNSFYMDKYNRNIPYFSKRNKNIDLIKFDSIVNKIENDVVVTQGISNEELLIVQKYFPYHIGYKEGFTFEINTYAKSKQSSQIIYAIDTISVIDFKGTNSIWKFNDSKVKLNSKTLSYEYEMSKEDEWGPSLLMPLDSFNKNDIIDISAEINLLDTLSECLIAFSIIENDELIFFKASDFRSFNSKTNLFNYVFLSVDMNFATRKIKNRNNCKVRINLWNAGKSNLLLRKIEVTRRPANIGRYWLYNRITSG